MNRMLNKLNDGLELLDINQTKRHSEKKFSILGYYISSVGQNLHPTFSEMSIMWQTRSILGNVFDSEMIVNATFFTICGVAYTLLVVLNVPLYMSSRGPEFKMSYWTFVGLYLIVEGKIASTHSTSMQKVLR